MKLFVLLAFAIFFFEQYGGNFVVPEKTNTDNGIIPITLSDRGLYDCKDFCTFEYNPVCGTDGNTYVNPCDLRVKACRNNQNIKEAHKGECKSKGTVRPIKLDTQLRRKTAIKCPPCCKRGCRHAFCANKDICPTEVPSFQIFPICPTCCKRGCKLPFCDNKHICPTQSLKCPPCCDHGCRHASCGDEDICPKKLSNREDNEGNSAYRYQGHQWNWLPLWPNPWWHLYD